MIEKNKETRENEEMETIKFINLLLHNLKTPLTSIKGFSQLINVQKEIDSEKKEHYIQIVSQNTEKLCIRLIELESILRDNQDCFNKLSLDTLKR